MKKNFLIIWLSISLLFPISSFARYTLGNTWDKPIQINAPVVIPEKWNLEYISLSFCDEELKNAFKENTMYIRPWQTKEICMLFVNSSSGDTIALSSSFVDATRGDDGKLVCTLWANDTGDSLVNLLSYDTKELNFTLAPKEKIIKKAKISIPQNMSWTLYGCVGYYLNQKGSDNNTWLFFVVRRKVGLMQINITWDIYNLGILDDMKYTYKDNQTRILNIIAGILVILFVYYVAMAMRGNRKKK
jgi:hypothetical protein